MVSRNSRIKSKSKKPKYAIDLVCTAEEAAVLEFEPWVDCKEPPTNEEWIKLTSPYLVSARIAWVTCQKTKPELVQVVDDLEEGQMTYDLFERFTEAQKFFQYFLNLFEKAEARIICAG